MTLLHRSVGTAAPLPIHTVEHGSYSSLTAKGITVPQTPSQQLRWNCVCNVSRFKVGRKKAYCLPFHFNKYLSVMPTVQRA